LTNTLTVCLAAVYIITSIPSSLPRRLSTKLAARLESQDYTHQNALRISKEVERALRYPADTVRVGLKRSFESLVVRKEDTTKLRTESEVARKYFSNLITDSEDIRNIVQRVDLEPAMPGAARI
jgi:mitofusin 2